MSILPCRIHTIAHFRAAIHFNQVTPTKWRSHYWESLWVPTPYDFALNPGPGSFFRDPYFMAYYNPHIHWGIFHPQPIPKTTRFFSSLLRWYEKSAYVVMFLVYLVASLGSPTNSGSTCEASNTQEDSLPEVLLLMLVVVDPQLYGQQKYCSSGWSKVLLLSCHLRHFSAHSTGKQSGTRGQTSSFV